MYYSFWHGSCKDYAVLKSEYNQIDELKFEKIGISEINFNEKSVIILCGNNTTSQRRAEFYAHLCRNWVDKFDQKKLKTYSIYYPSIQPLFNENLSLKLDYDYLALQMFNNIIFKGNKILSAEEIKNKLSNVVFFGHSAGGYVMNELMFSLGKILKGCDFSTVDIKKIYESIVFIAYAPYELVKSPVKSICVAPIYDSMGSSKLVYKHVLKSKNAISSAYGLNFGAKSNNQEMIEKFLNNCNTEIKLNNTIYFMNKNSVFSTPNLLYYDGKMEDHNFAGAIIYKTKNQHQTEAGVLTAKFLKHAFNYSLITKREQFNLKELYQHSLNIKLLENSLHPQI